MNKQIRSFCSYPGPQYTNGHQSPVGYRDVEVEDFVGTPPEISIFPAESTTANSNSSHQQEPEIDAYSGLPKLPVEPLPTSPEPSRAHKGQGSKLAYLPSALRNIMASESSPPKRKSVTFEESGAEQQPHQQQQQRREKGEEEGGVKPSSSESSGLRRTRTSDTVIFRETMQAKQRGNGRPTSLPNRTRSVFIRLNQPTRPALALKNTSKRLTTSGSVLSDSSVPSDSSDPDPRILDPSKEREPKDGVTILEGGGGGREEDGTGSPLFSAWNTGRRSSFLYHQGASSGGDDEFSADGYVTPFAQILSNLHHVRAGYLALMGLPEDTKTTFSRSAWAPAHSPSLPRKISPGITDKKMAMEVLQDLDWSLKMLEAVNANQSMGNVTGDKIKRLLNRELSHLSEGSHNGAQVAEWVNNITNPEPYDMDRVLGSPAVNYESFEHSLSASVSHDNWVRRKHLEAPNLQTTKRRITVEAESVPKFGVECANKNMQEMTEYMESKLFCWDVDVFRFNELTSGNSLVSASYLVFKKRNIFTELQISPYTFINFMTNIQNLYHKANPYHNAMHATDVMLTTNQLLSADSLDGVFSPVEIMAALVAAAVHDVDHPGYTNLFLIAVRNDLALMYNDISILENHHAATAFRTMQKPKCNFLERLDMDCVQLFRHAVIDMVLSTDMGKHIQNVAEMKTLIETKKLTNDGLLSLGNYKENSAVLKCLIHCADLSNPTKIPSLAADWSYRIMEENFKQGDKEKELGITVHAMGDREGVSIPKCQISFIDFIVYPLWETWAELVYPDAQHVLDSIAKTKSYWFKLAEKECAEEKPSLDVTDSNKEGDGDDGGGGAGDNSSSGASCCAAGQKQCSKSSAPSSTPSSVPPCKDSSSSSSSSVEVSMSLAGSQCCSGGAVESVNPASCGSDSDQVSLDGSADSETLRSAFESSPANQRRSSYRSAKTKAISEATTTSQQENNA